MEEIFSVCTNCGSKEVHSDLSTGMIAFGGSYRMICDKCGYEAVTFPQMNQKNYKKYLGQIENRTQKDKNKLKKANQTKLIGN